MPLMYMYAPPRYTHMELSFQHVAGHLTHPPHDGKNTEKIPLRQVTSRPAARPHFAYKALESKDGLHNIIKH